MHRLTALQLAWIQLHLITLRFDAPVPLHDMGPPPAFGAPLPWYRWGGVSSLEFDLFALPLFANLAVLGALWWLALTRISDRARTVVCVVALPASVYFVLAHHMLDTLRWGWISENWSSISVAFEATSW